MDKGNKTTKDSSVYSLFSNLTRNRKPLIAWAMKHNNETFTRSDTGHVLRQESKKQHLKLSSFRKEYCIETALVARSSSDDQETPEVGGAFGWSW